MNRNKILPMSGRLLARAGLTVVLIGAATGAASDSRAAGSILPPDGG